MTKGRPPLRASGPFFCLLLLSCGSSTEPSAEESRRLDNAEEMLNAAPDELSDVDAGDMPQPEQNATVH